MHLQEAHQQLSAFALHIEDLTMLNERQRLARELHDTLVQGMAGVLMQLEVIATHARQSHLERVQTLLQQAMADTREVLSDARCALSDLRAEHVRPDDLVEVVLEEIHRFTASTDIPCVAQIEPLAHTPPALCVQVLRVISEGLTNIARHAQARQVEVRASFAGPVLQLELCDDGVGFDPATIKPEEGHYGLLGLRERAHLIGGHLLIVSQPGQGTRLCLQIPLISSEEACA
jgi:NarL family two-component system sensor histidine kinase YdfH